jgi:energy-converting hydrogenase Eha subunit G
LARRRIACLRQKTAPGIPKKQHGLSPTFKKQALRLMRLHVLALGAEAMLMDFLLWLLYRGVLVVHVAAMALTLSAVLREDWRVLTTRRINARRLARTARAALLGLSALASTGAVLVVLGVLGAALAPSPWLLLLLSSGITLLVSVIGIGVLLALMALRASRVPLTGQRAH